MSIEYGLVFTFFFGAIRYSIFDFFFVQVTLSHFRKFKIIVGMSLVITLFLLINFFLCPKKKKKILIAMLLRIYYVRPLSVSYRMNVRTSQKMLDVHR